MSVGLLGQQTTALGPIVHDFLWLHFFRFGVQNAELRKRITRRVEGMPPLGPALPSPPHHLSMRKHLGLITL